MFRAPKSCHAITVGCLHSRGGVSFWTCKAVRKSLSSSHLWRCFLHAATLEVCNRVVSTCVEVFQCNWKLCFYTSRFLHKYGGVSFWTCKAVRRSLSSSRMWRCFSQGYRNRTYHFVVSTCVEVFLLVMLMKIMMSSCLHVCGGVSS